ncbi:MAG: MBOAT family protein [Deltaproteobacteria bacterium]|nr:MBOAT family protein [Deltaproteobacteria bacterium]
MPFSSLLFIHVFLPAFLIAYWLTPRRAKNWTAIVASLVFYAWGAPRFLPVVFALGVIDYLISHRIAALAGGRKKALLIAGVAMHLSVLVYFKYSNFFVGELDALLGVGITWTKVVLPIGISFITFEEISYLTDVYRGAAQPARRLSNYLLFLTLFPHSIAGPIFRWKDLEAQLVERTHSWELVREGFERFARGLAKKLLVADSVAIIADAMFTTPGHQLTTGFAWIGAVAYAIQIYFDFSGYSDMAIGLGKMIGFRFKENFDRPYISASLTEFWTRWHISLSTWLRDYLYIPLGGNRRGPRRAIINLVLVFALSGLWHGAAWTFVIWGLFHGTFVALERVIGPRRERIPKPLQHVLTLLLVLVGWVVFRADTAGGAATVLRAMFGFATATDAGPVPGVAMPHHALVMLALGVAIALAPIATKYWTWEPRIPLAATIAARVGYVLIFMMSTIHLTNMRITPLIYFKF